MAAHTDEIILDALMDAVRQAVDEGAMSQETFIAICKNEPESQDFQLEAGEQFDDEDAEIVSFIGANERYAKIEYWRVVVDSLPERAFH